ncbi:MAG TPA: DUF933 domain-containing protein, partial [Longimicrobiales bacterium]
MKIGLVGFAGSGKTTVFNAMTGMEVPVGFGGELRLGSVRVPDMRIDRLSQMFRPKKTIYAEITFADIPGEHGAENKGLSRRALQTIRDQEALCLVLRDFENPALESKADPLRDLEAFHAECILADLEIVERAIDRGKKTKAPPLEIATFEKMKHHLEAEKPLRALSHLELNREHLKGFGLLTDRPLLVALNVSEANASRPMPDALAKRVAALDAAGLALSASVESEIAALAPEDQAAFLADLGLRESALARFIRAAYGLLDLISVFTVGPDEVRAWTIHRGMNARQAAGRIHSDLERGFIRAEVIAFDDYIRGHGEAGAREAGRLRLEGKEYVVQEGDVMHFR